MPPALVEVGFGMEEKRRKLVEISAVLVIIMEQFERMKHNKRNLCRLCEKHRMCKR